MTNKERLQKIDDIRHIKMAVLDSIPVSMVVLKRSIGNICNKGYHIVDTVGAEDFDAASCLNVAVGQFRREKYEENNARYSQEFLDVVEYFLGWRIFHNVHSNKDEFGFPPEWLGGEGQGWSFKCKLDDYANEIGNQIVEKFLETTAKEKV